MKEEKKPLMNRTNSTLTFEVEQVIEHLYYKYKMKVYSTGNFKQTTYTSTRSTRTPQHSVPSSKAA
jgi:hypothetical protein